MVFILIGIILIAMIVYLVAAWRWQCRRNPMCHVPQELDMINLGSTYAFYDFAYTDTEKSGANLANVPQYLDMDYLLLQKYIDHLKKGGKVLIVLPSFVFASLGGEYNRKVYYEALHRREIKNFDKKRYWKCVWKAAKEPFFHEYKKQKERWKGHVASIAEKQKHADGRIADWEGKLGVVSVRTGEITETLRGCIRQNQKIVKDMIAFCREHEAEPVLILPPTSEIMNQKVADTCIEAYLKEPVLQIVKDTDVRMFDYLRQENLQSEKLYLNSDCLNAEGQKVFMEQLMKDIWDA